jgi:hypothetical protein
MNVTITQLVPDTADAPTRPEHLAGAILRSLGRSFDGRFAWGSVRTLVLGLVSFGYWPLLAWTGSLRNYVRLEQQQLWHLAEWMRLQSGHPDAAKLRELAETIRWRGALAGCALLWAVLPLGLFIAQHGGSRQIGRPLMEGTYLYLQTPAPTYSSGGEAGLLFTAWTAGLSLAYAFHWLQVQLHAADVRRFFTQFNALATWEGVPPVRTRRIGLGIGIGSMAGGVLVIVLGGIWGIPMLVAGTAQRRYISVAGGRMRAEAGEAVRKILSVRRPVLRVASFVTPTGVCRESMCRQPLSPLARFCPRCGARAGLLMSEIA